MTRPRRAGGITAVVACLAVAAGGAAAAPPRAGLLVVRDQVIATTGQGGSGQVPPVAYLVNRGGPVDVELRRAPGTATWDAVQVVDGARLPVPATVPIGPTGLGRAVAVTVLDRARRVVRRRALDLCLDASALRLGPAGPALSTFPQECSYHPFARGLRQGLDTDYGVPLDLSRVVGYGLRPGRYRVRVRMRPETAEWLGMAPDARAATLGLRVRRVRGPRGAVLRALLRGDLAAGYVSVPAPSAVATRRRAVRHRPEPRTAPPPPTDVAPPADVLPNLAALPAYWFATTREKGRDRLQFSATIWNAGPGPMIVEGYRRGPAPRMAAYQFFRRGDQDVAAVPVGGLEYDARAGHDHWHFRDFARYSLVRADGRRAAVSPKEAWCLAPTDQIDQLVPNAALRSGDPFLESACGDADAVQVREVLEVGSGDTYGLGTPGQAIDITRLPNGVYFLKIEANPSGFLRETTRDDDVALRRIVLGGRPGSRTVHAPPADGVDTDRDARLSR